MSLNKAITALVLVIFVMNCSKEINEPGSKSGHLVVHLTDVPGNYSEVNITFSEIDVHIDSEWIVILTEQKKSIF